MPGIYLPDGYQYVGAAISSTFFVLAYQSILVGQARKRAGIKYPQLYAEKAEAAASKEAHVFNCTQRAHQNTLETINIVTVGTALAGLKYPVFAAAACGAWSVARVAYTMGYKTGNPDKRSNFVSIFGSISLLALTLVNGYVWGKAAITGEF